MVTAPNDYIKFLYQIQNPNRQTQAIIFSDNEPLYEIDLNTRTILAPSFLSVEYDHNAETIYFLVDRYYDNIDLSQMFAVVQYENADPVKERRGWIYPVPYFDINGPFVPEGKMIFPWVIQGPATAYAGTVTFAVKFYRLKDLEIDHENGTTRYAKEYEYVLNTVPTTSKVLHGMDIYTTSENYIYPENTVESLYQAIEEVRRQNDLYWIVLSDEEDPTMHVNPTVEGATDKTNQVYDTIS